MKVKIRSITTFSLIWMLVFGLFMLQPAVANEGNISTSDKYAWAENAGWLNFRPTHGGVTVYPDHLEGYAWAENIGWVKLGSHSGGGAHTYANTTKDNWGVNHDGVGNLSGFAWSETVGWINFNPTHSQVTIDLNTGDFEGYAWSENMGWVHFSNATPAYKVATAGADDVTIEKAQDLAVDRGTDPDTGDPFVWAGDIISYTIEAEHIFDTAVSMMISDALNGFVDYVEDSLKVYEDGTEVTGLNQWDILSYDDPSDLWSLAYASDPLNASLLITFDVKVEVATPLQTLIWNIAELTYIGGLRIEEQSNTVQVVVIPEPATLLLLGTGLLGLFAFAQRKRRQRK